MLGWTQSEPEWNDSERAKMEALALFEARVCECGMHESVADEDPDLDLDFRVCPVCAGVAQAMRLQAAIDEKPDDLKKQDEAARSRPDDGRHVRLRPKAPR